jgi:hypothetical protein
MFELVPISDFSNFTTKGIYLVDKLRLCRPTNSRITRLDGAENELGSRITLIILKFTCNSLAKDASLQL